MRAFQHLSIEPAMHHWGKPIVLVNTCNAHGSANLAPMS